MCPKVCFVLTQSKCFVFWKFTDQFQMNYNLAEIKLGPFLLHWISAKMEIAGMLEQVYGVSMITFSHTILLAVLNLANFTHRFS